MSDKEQPTLLHSFLLWEKTQPDAIYLTEPRADGGVWTFTWREVGEQARRMASYLHSLQLPEQAKIAILGKNSAHWLIADLAVWMAGYVSVPLYTTMSADTARYIVDHGDVSLLFVGKLDGKSDNWPSISAALPHELKRIGLPTSPPLDRPTDVSWGEIMATTPPLSEVHLPAPGDLATVIYTSGSTGLPKGAMHSFGSITAYAKGSASYAHTNADDRLLSYLPLAHAAERAFVETISLYNGCQVYFSDSLETFAADLQRARPTLFISMPRLWYKFYAAVCARLPAEQQALLAEHTDTASALKTQVLTMLGLQAVRMAFTGSAPLPLHIVEWYRNLGLELLEVYGMTEDFCYSHYSQPGQVRLGYCGPPLPGVERRFGDDNEIWIKSPTQMLGYYKEPALTAQCMTADGFFKTGDRGEVDELGRLRITGRVKEVFKTSKGKYVAPAPIENKFIHPKIESVCVTGPSFPQPFALVTLVPEVRSGLSDPAMRDSLIQELQALLSKVNESQEEHEKLAHIVVVKDGWSMDNGFLTPTMKIRRSLIEKHYLARSQSWADQNDKVILDS